MDDPTPNNSSIASPRSPDAVTSPRPVTSPRNVDQEMHGDNAQDTSSKASTSSAHSSVLSGESSVVQPDLKRSKLAISTTITTTPNSKTTKTLKTVITTYKPNKPMSGRMSVPVNKLLSSQKSSTASGRLSAPLTRTSTLSSLGSTNSSLRSVPGGNTLEFAKSLYNQKRFRQAYPIFDKLAQAKDVAAMYYKAVMLLDGLGIHESNREGLMALKRTYEQSIRVPCDPEYRHLACYQIGLAYSRGVGARQDLGEAVKWWQKAANEVRYDPSSQIAFDQQLNTEAGTLCQMILARHYASLRPNPDWEKCYNWYKEAAQNGSVESMYQTGILTWYGLGCPTDDAAKHHETIQNFLGQAATAGNICAMCNLAMYCLEKNLQEGAFMWATKAIEIVTQLPNRSTLGAAVKSVTAMPNNENDEESVTKSISMAYFVLAHLHNVGAVATIDKDKAAEFYEAASAIDVGLVQSLTNLLESELHIKSETTIEQ